jgi:hypothetical protein
MMSIYSEILTGLIIVSIILMGIGVAAQFNLVVKAASIIFLAAFVTNLFINILIQSSEKKSSKEIEKTSFEKGYKEAIMDCKGDSIDNKFINLN